MWISVIGLGCVEDYSLNWGVIISKFGNWEVTDTINQGGQGQIHIVKDTKNQEKDEEFVLKQLINKKRLNRFKDEINVCMSLEHPNIVHIIDFNWENKPPFMVMPYYQNGDLTNLKLDQISLSQKLEIFKNITEAVAFAHQNNVVHRDLKPENIFLNDDYDPVVADFGLCFIDNDDGERFTFTEEAVGSRYYMAPELAEGKIENVTKTSDVYSLGKILYWLLKGNIFDRERHRHETNDLTIDNPKREYHLINELLDKMIVEDSNDRLEDAIVALNDLNTLIRRIENGANCIDVNVPQNCIYCGLGEYKIVSNKPHQIYGKTTMESYFNFPDDKKWMLFQCDHCLNIQLFRPILKDVPNRWIKEDKK